MSVVAVAVISKEGKPLAIKTKSGMGKDQELKVHHLLNCSLDFVDEKQAGLNNRDSYLSLLCQLETFKVYALVTTTRTKILLMVSTQSSVTLRDSDVKSMLKNIHNIYMESTACNPFHETGSLISSKAFDEKIKYLFSPVDIVAPTY